MVRVLSNRACRDLLTAAALLLSVLTLVLFPSEAVEAAKHRAVGRIVASAVIANPHEETMKLVEVSARKYAKLREERP